MGITGPIGNVAALGFAAKKEEMLKKTQTDCADEMITNQLQTGVPLPGQQCIDDLKQVQALSKMESVFKNL